MRRPVFLFALCFTAPALAADPVRVADGWARATLPGQDSSAAYLTLTAPDGDTLSGLASPSAGMVMLHRTVREDGHETMVDVDGLNLPPGQPIRLKPRGLHIMLMDMKQPLKAGDTLKLTLTFAKAGQQTVEVPVKPVSANGP